jgi:hypothetical protein
VHIRTFFVPSNSGSPRRRPDERDAPMKLLPNDAGQLAEEPEYFGLRMFLKRALEQFPELADDPDVTIGIHVCMSALKRLALDSLRSGEAITARAVVDFLDRVLESPRLDPEIPNAVSASFLEPADLEPFAAGRSFLDSMPSSVRRLLV